VAPVTRHGNRAAARGDTRFLSWLTGIAVWFGVLEYFFTCRTFIAGLPDQTNADGLLAVGLILAISAVAAVAAGWLAREADAAEGQVAPVTRDNPATQVTAVGDDGEPVIVVLIDETDLLADGASPGPAREFLARLAASGRHQ
jgi:hypothetical protein